MLKHRVIPILLYNENMQCVQTTKFGRPYRTMGTLMQYIRTIEKRNVDELILLDITATEQKRGPNFDAIREFTSHLFCPVTIGGGISTIGHVTKLIKECGADKVAIKSALFHEEIDPTFIVSAVQKFGAQAIVAVLDVGVENQLVHVNDWHGPTPDVAACIVRQMGVGEILLTSMCKNGLQAGYDTDLIRIVTEDFGIPVIANGGCGEPAHMIEAIRAGASAVAASTMFLLTEHTPKDCAIALDAAGVAARLDG